MDLQDAHLDSVKWYSVRPEEPMALSEVQLMCFKVGFCTETHGYYVMNELDDIK